MLRRVGVPPSKILPHQIDAGSERIERVAWNASTTGNDAAPMAEITPACARATPARSSEAGCTRPLQPRPTMRRAGSCRRCRSLSIDVRPHRWRRQGVRVRVACRLVWNEVSVVTRARRGLVRLLYAHSPKGVSFDRDNRGGTACSHGVSAVGIQEPVCHYIRELRAQPRHLLAPEQAGQWDRASPATARLNSSRPSTAKAGNKRMNLLKTRLAFTSVKRDECSGSLPKAGLPSSAIR